MKIKKGLILKEVAGNYLVVAVGSAVKTVKGMITLNETGAFLWKLVEQGTDRADLIKNLLNEYEVDEQTASKDVDTFIKSLEDAKLLEN